MTQPLNRRLLTEDQASPLSDATPVAPTSPPSPGVATSVSRADHSHSTAGSLGRFGTGVDGDIVLDGVTDFLGFASRSGTVYTLTRPVAFMDLTVNSGVTLRPGGFIVNVLGVLSGGGAIEASVGTVKVKNFNQTFPGSVGPTGGTGAGSGGSVLSEVFAPEAAGGAGGLGSSGAGGAGGNPGDDWANDYGVTYLLNTNIDAAFTGTYFLANWGNSPSLTNMNIGAIRALVGGASGGAGGGDGTNSGGAGGWGGQVVIVNARKVVGTIAVRAPGGAGGAATAGNTGGGGGGAGGFALLNSLDLADWTGTITAAGGAGGAKFGTGVVGSAGGAGFARATEWS